jgi:hypothetical protein
LTTMGTSLVRDEPMGPGTGFWTLVATDVAFSTFFS